MIKSFFNDKSLDFLMSTLDFLIFLLTPLSQNVILKKRIAIEEALSHLMGSAFFVT